MARSVFVQRIEFVFLRICFQFYRGDAQSGYARLGRLCSGVFGLAEGVVLLFLFLIFDGRARLTRRSMRKSMLRLCVKF